MNRVLREFFRTGFFFLTLLAGYGATAQTLRYTTSSKSVKNCDNSEITFTDKSTPPSGATIVSEIWQFPHSSDSTFAYGSITGSTQQGIVYYKPGVYNVSLRDSFSNGNTETLDTSITILPKAIPYFYVKNGGVCDDSSITFVDTTNTSAESASSYLWYFGDSTTSTSANPPPHKYKGPGGYNVALVVTSNNGCVDSLPKQATVFDFPVLAMDSLIMANTCIGTATFVHYYLTYKYNGIQSVFFNFNTADVPPTSKDTMTINNSYNPNLLGELLKDSTVYTNPSTGKIDSIVYFNDTVATAQYASFYHVYNDTGSYNVLINVQTVYGCNISVKKNVLVTPLPHDSFTITSGCRNSGDEFTDFSTVGHPSHITKVYFIFGDSTGTPGHRVATPTDTIFPPFAGKFPITHIYPQTDIDTTYRVVEYALTETGCFDSMVRIAKVYSILHDSFTINNGLNSGCPNFPVQFVDKSYPVTKNPLDTAAYYKWNFGDKSSGALNTADSAQPQHTYKTTGTYTVADSVYTSRGCRAFSTLKVTIYPPPKTAIGVPFPICDESHITNAAYFQDSSTPPNKNLPDTAWWWDFGDFSSAYNFSNLENPTHYFSDTGTYEVKHVAITNEGCTDTDSVAIHVIPSPSAAFTTPGVCLGQNTQFKDNSTGVIKHYYWDFGDGTPADTLQNPTHKYTTAASYQVTHAVVSSTGCSDTVRQPVIVYQPPSAYIRSTSTTSICSSYGIATFYDSSSNNAASAEWSFGDGKSSGGFTVNHTFANPGDYTVTDTVTTSNQCKAFATLLIRVDSLPGASMATPVDVCAKSPASFIDNTAYVGAYTQTWDFGDGTAKVKGTKFPTHVYTDSGTYTVTIFDTTTYGGCGAYSSQNIYIYPGPLASFYLNTIDPPYVCVNAPVTFINTSTTTSSYKITGYVWIFGDGATSFQQNPPPHTFTTAGKDTVQLVAINNGGCSDTFPLIITVSPLPEPNYKSSLERCSGYAVSFTAQDALAHDPVGSNYTWYINGNFYQTGINPSPYIFPPGPNSIWLAATNAYGCTDTSKTTINIYSTPVPNFNSAIVCQGQPSLLEDASTLQYLGFGDTINSWYWQFDDSTSDSGQNISHTFQSAGSHNVELTVTTNHLCQQSITKAVTVNVSPMARIVYIPNPININNPRVTFYDSSTNSIPRQNWWDLGDGYYRADSATVTHTYDTSGHYIVRLAVSNTDGCVDTVSDTIWVEPVFTMWIPDAFTPNGDGINDVWKPVSQGVVTYELEIINIWGGEVFRTTDPNAAWIGDDDGNGKICPDGMYIYRIVCTDVFDQVIHTFKGNITLLK